MTRKHYALIAQALKATKPDEYSDKLTQWQQTVASVATSLRRDNPRFDLDRFYTACAYGAGL